MNENENITTATEDEDILLPDGWQEGDDIFAEGYLAGGTQADAPAETPGQGPEEAAGEQTDAPTTEQTDAPGVEAADEDAPTTEQTAEQPNNKLRFKARVDRQDLDVEVDESELPALYQKAQVTERMQARMANMTPKMERAERLAKSMGYDSLDEMLESTEKNYQTREVRRLVAEGVHEEVAKDMVSRRLASTPPQNEGAAPAAEKAAARDFGTEVRELLEARPELAGKQLPREVVDACALKGKPLTVAYAEYEAEQQKAEADRLRRENEILRQNAAAASKAPVKAATGGGATDVKPKDDFLTGFDSE